MVKGIYDSVVYARESKNHYLPDFYYLVLWNDYFEEKNIWKLASVKQYLRKMISTFHKNYPDKLSITSSPINIPALMFKPIIKLVALKQKYSQPTKLNNKRKKIRTSARFLLSCFFLNLCSSLALKSPLFFIRLVC